MVPAPFAAGKGPGPPGPAEGIPVQSRDLVTPGSHAENYFLSEWRGGSGQDFSRTAGCGSAPWTMVEVLQRPGHLCLDKSFSVNALACTASCSRGPWSIHIHSKAFFPASAFLPPLSCLLPPRAPVIPWPTLTPSLTESVKAKAASSPTAG